MRAAVTLRLPNGTTERVAAGGLIGRVSSAALRLEDPRISEAHAMVSLRGRRLVLMSLRGSLRVGRSKVERIDLTQGRRIDLAGGFTVEVVEIELPDTTLALTGLGLLPVELESEVATIHADPWRIEPGYDASGKAHISATGGGWAAHIEDETIALEPGVKLRIGDHAVGVVEVPLSGRSGTLRQIGDQSPMRLVARYDSVHILRDERDTVVLNGMSAKILTELVRYGSPVPWEWVARELFGPINRVSARMRWDRNLKTLRRKLREGGVRGDLAFCDGHGNVELVIGPRDTIVDES